MNIFIVQRPTRFYLAPSREAGASKTCVQTKLELGNERSAQSTVSIANRPEGPAASG